MENCLFCKIAAGEIPSKKAYEDETVMAFYDLEPQAPVHVLVIPKAHMQSAASVTPENSAVVAHIFEVIARLAQELGLKEGFRVVTNSGVSAGQSVLDMCFARDMPCGASKGIYIISYANAVSIYRICEANISRCAATYRFELQFNKLQFLKARTGKRIKNK